MKAFLMEECLPFALVCTVVVGLTVAFFGVPKAAPLPPPSRTQVPPEASVRRMDDALNRAIAALRAARSQADSTLPPSTKPRPPPSAAAPRTRAAGAATQAASAKAAVAAAPEVPLAPAAGLPEPTDPAANAPVMSAVASLTDAVKAVRSARTEEDFVRAEEQMRAVRSQMQAACTSGANSAFCDSANEMGSLGF